ncbi:MAG: glycosyltransferase [Desulfovibrionaceae bacterium]|nr:glycosyltransferase [Desulfovibrionaceae bacterium]
MHSKAAAGNMDVVLHAAQDLQHAVTKEKKETGTALNAATPERSARTILSSASFESGPLLWVHKTLCCGGIERQLSVTAQEFCRLGMDDVHLLCTSLEPQRGHDFFLPSVQAALHRIHLLHALPESVINELLPLALRRIEQIDRFTQGELSELILFTLWMLHLRPKCVHVWLGDIPLPALAACMAGVPRVILSGQSLSPRRRTPFGLEGPDVKKTLRTYSVLRKYPAFHMTNNSRAGREDYADWLDYPAEKITIFTNAMPLPAINNIDKTALRHDLGLAPDAKIIAGAFRFVSIKNPQLWIAAAQRTLAQIEDAVAVLWGDGPLLAECRSMVDQSGWSDRILLPGKAADGISALSISDVVLLSSTIEGLPNVLLEAQSLGIPVVATQVGGVADAFVHERSGWLVARRTPEALAERLVWVLRNPEWAKQARQDAIAHVSEHFSLQHTMTALQSLYYDAYAPCVNI